MTNNNDGINKTMDEMDDFIHRISISMRDIGNKFCENIIEDGEKKKKPKIPREQRREWMKSALSK